MLYINNINLDMQEKPNVLQVIPTLNISGAEQGCFDVANFLINNKLKSHIATSAGYRIEQLENSGTLINKIPVHSKNPIIILINAFRLIKIIKKNEINIIHARSRAPAWSCYLAAKLANIKFITTFHGTYNFSNKIKKFYNSIMIRSDYVIAISNFIYSEIRTKYLYTHQNVSVILRGVDINYFNPSLIDHNLLKQQIDQYSLRKNSIKIILPGRVSFWKGHAIAIEAMSYLKEKINKDFELIFVGPINNDKLKVNLLNKINEFKLQDNIKFVGSSKKMNLIYSLADIVLSCSTDPEAFGRIPVEAQSMGKIIIASDHGGHKETVCEGISGFLYDPNQPQDLADAILKVLVSEQYLDKSYQLKRRNLIIENYTVEKMCQQTLEIYNKVLVA